MKIESIRTFSYSIPLITGTMRFGALICVTDQQGHIGWGDIAPLPGWSDETLAKSLEQLREKHDILMKGEWSLLNCFQKLATLELLPSVIFGFESALLSILCPLADYSIDTSALFMGSPAEILAQAKLKRELGYTFAKLKVSHLTFKEAAFIIHQLKNSFRLRIDVNRAWSTAEALHFFSQFPLDTFDYVEEPFKNPQDLAQFLHPLAIDESFPKDLSLQELELLPTLKALIYKPTIQGGMLNCFPLCKWAAQRGVAVVLSSSFESDIGVAGIALMARRLALSAPIGIGTYDYLTQAFGYIPLMFCGSKINVKMSLNFNLDCF